MKIILASSSPRRRELLSHIGVDFSTAVPPASAEASIEACSYNPAEFAEKNAFMKAGEVAKISPKDSIVLGADTIVVLGDVILGKPKDGEDAKKMLLALSGKMHEVITGVTVINNKIGRSITSHESTEVFFKKLSSEEIDFYIKSGEPMDKAGAYAIQGLGSLFVPGIKGCFFNVVGLPLFKCMSMIRDISED